MEIVRKLTIKEEERIEKEEWKQWGSQVDIKQRKNRKKRRELLYEESGKIENKDNEDNRRGKGYKRKRIRKKRRKF